MGVDKEGHRRFVLSHFRAPQTEQTCCLFHTQPARTKTQLTKNCFLFGVVWLCSFETKDKDIT